MSKRVSNILLLCAVVVIVGLSLLLGQRQVEPGTESFGGTDGSATEQIEEANPDYEPWFTPFFEPSGEVESGLFALQAAAGSGVVCFVLGALWQRHRTSREVVPEPAPQPNPESS